MCHVCRDNTCHYGEYCRDSYLSPEEVDLIVNPPAFESKMRMKDTTTVTIDEAPEKAMGIIKKQSEVWVYDDEVYASYSKALAASLKDTILEPMCRSFYERNGYSASDIDRSVAAQKKQKFKSFAFYADDMIAALPLIIEAVKDAQARKD